MINKLTVISAIYNDELCIELYLDRIKPVLDMLKGNPEWQIIFVDDGSSDSSCQIVHRLAKNERRIKLLALSRNFGYQNALLAGLKEIESDYYAIIDVDCEDPPRLLDEFWGHIQEGNQLVYGIRSQRKEPPLLVWCRKMFYRLNRLLADSNIYMWMSEFSMFTKLVRDSIILPRTTFTFLRSEMAYIGYRAKGILYQREHRIAGKSHYNVWGMTKFAIAGILASTTFPLRAVLYLSGIFLIIFTAFCFIVQESIAIGVFTIILLFLYVLISLPLISIYLARTYRNIVNRPNYLIDPHQSIF